MALPQLAQRVEGRRRQKGEKSRFLIPWSSALKTCTGAYGEMEGAGGEHAAPQPWEDGHGRGGFASPRAAAALRQPGAASAGLGFEQDPLPLPSNRPCSIWPQSQISAGRCKREKRKKREKKGKRRKGGKTHCHNPFTSSQNRSRGHNTPLCSCAKRFGPMQC